MGQEPGTSRSSARRINPCAIKTRLDTFKDSFIIINLFQERYDNELRSFLKTTGMHASDLVKPKAKRTSKPSTRPSAASATLSPSGQQMAQTLMGMTSQSPRSQQGGNSATPSASLPNFSQAWTGQAIGNEQLLAQMGLAGYANSDGSISLDNNSLANLIIQQAQQQQSLQLVSSGSQQAPYWSVIVPFRIFIDHHHCRDQSNLYRTAFYVSSL